MVDLNSVEPVTVEEANKYIRDNFSDSRSIGETDEDIRGEVLDQLFSKKNPELELSTIGENWDSLSDSYGSKSEFFVEAFNQVFTEKLREKIPESERDTFIKIHVTSLEDHY